LIDSDPFVTIGDHTGHDKVEKHGGSTLWTTNISTKGHTISHNPPKQFDVKQNHGLRDPPDLFKAPNYHSAAPNRPSQRRSNITHHPEAKPVDDRYIVTENMQNPAFLNTLPHTDIKQIVRPPQEVVKVQQSSKNFNERGMHDRKSFECSESANSLQTGQHMQQYSSIPNIVSNIERSFNAACNVRSVQDREINITIQSNPNLDAIGKHDNKSQLVFDHPQNTTEKGNTFHIEAGTANVTKDIPEEKSCSNGQILQNDSHDTANRNLNAINCKDLISTAGRTKNTNNIFTDKTTGQAVLENDNQNNICKSKKELENKSVIKQDQDQVTIKNTVQNIIDLDISETGSQNNVTPLVATNATFSIATRSEPPLVVIDDDFMNSTVGETTSDITANREIEEKLFFLEEASENASKYDDESDIMHDKNDCSDISEKTTVDNICVVDDTVDLILFD
jgi:hypothetical protein